MNHKITVAACIVLLAVLGALSYVAWNNQQVRQSAAVAHAKASERISDSIAKQREANKLAKYKVECQKGLTAYNALPATQKAKTAMPQCNLQPLE